MTRLLIVLLAWASVAAATVGPRCEQADALACRALMEIECDPGEFLSAYDATSGAFTCSPLPSTTSTSTSTSTSSSTSTSLGATTSSSTSTSTSTTSTSTTLDPDLSAIAGLTGVGFPARVADDTWLLRVIEEITGETVVTNGDGVSGNPTIGLADTAVTPGTYGDGTHVAQVTVDAKGRVTTASDVAIVYPTTTTSTSSTTTTSTSSSTSSSTSTSTSSSTTTSTSTSSTTTTLDPDLAAIAGLTGVGFPARIAANSWLLRILAGTAPITVTDGDGVAGAPTISLDDTAVTPGTYGDGTHVGKFTVDQKGRLTFAQDVAIAFPTTTTATTSTTTTSTSTTTTSTTTSTSTSTTTSTSSTTVTTTSSSTTTTTLFIDVRSGGAVCNAAIAPTTAVVSGTDDTTAIQSVINAATAGATIVIPSGKRCKISGKITIKDGIRLQGLGGSGVILSAKQCTAGNFVGSECSSDADCYNGGSSTTGLCTGTQFAPTLGTAYPVFDSTGRAAEIDGVSVWTMQVAPYHTCAATTTGGRLGKSCTTNNSNADTGCPTLGSCGGTARFPSGSGKINVVDFTGSTGVTTIKNMTVYDLRNSDAIWKAGSSAFAAISSTQPAAYVEKNRVAAYNEGICNTTDGTPPGDFLGNCGASLPIGGWTKTITAGVSCPYGGCRIAGNELVAPGGSAIVYNVGNVDVDSNHVYLDVMGDGATLVGIEQQVNNQQSRIRGNFVEWAYTCLKINGANVNVIGNRCYAGSGPKVVDLGGAGHKYSQNYWAWGTSDPVFQQGGAGTSEAIAFGTSHLELDGNVFFSQASTPTEFKLVDVGKRCSLGYKAAAFCSTSNEVAATGCPGSNNVCTSNLTPLTCCTGPNAGTCTANSGCTGDKTPGLCCTGVGTGTCAAPTCAGSGSTCCDVPTHVAWRLENNVFLSGSIGVDYSAFTSSATNTIGQGHVANGNLFSGTVTPFKFPTTTGSIATGTWVGNAFDPTNSTSSLLNWDAKFGNAEANYPQVAGDEKIYAPTYTYKGAGSSAIGSAMTVDSSCANCVKTAPVNSTAILGVAMDDAVADGAKIRVAIAGYVKKCLVDSAVAKGDRLKMGATTAGQSKTATSSDPSFAIANDSTAGSGSLPCSITTTYPTTSTHNMLSATHADSTAASATRGDIITAQGASPTWSRLAKGATGTYLSMGANEPAWASVPVFISFAGFETCGTDTTVYLGGHGCQTVESNTRITPDSAYPMTITGLFCGETTDSACDMVYTVRVNGSSSSVTCQENNSLGCNDTAHTAAVGAGQTIDVLIADDGTPGCSTNINTYCTIRATVP